MRKMILIISGSLVIIIVIVLIVVLFNKTKYIIKVSMVDNRSPDRVLTVYNQKNEKVEVERIEYINGTLLCKGYNTTVHFGDIENIKELNIILKDKSQVRAKIVEDEVK